MKPIPIGPHPFFIDRNEPFVINHAPLRRNICNFAVQKNKKNYNNTLIITYDETRYLANE